MDITTTDAGMVPFVTGLTNIITAYLPSKWSRFFPLIPLALGTGYGFLTSDPAKAGVGPMGIALYSLIRNAAGTKPKDAK